MRDKPRQMGETSETTKTKETSETSETRETRKTRGDKGRQAPSEGAVCRWAAPAPTCQVEGSCT